jgi:elongator complex protein 3
MRQDLKTIMDKDGTCCHCIRCREVGLKSVDKKNDMVPILTTRSYNASNGTEYFISFENKSKSTIYGFARLRLSKVQMLECLQGCALLRELHVYGKVAVVGSKEGNGSVQHKGMGKALVAKAEAIAREKGYKKIAVIAGEGVKPYYEKLGYIEKETYMINELV